MDEQRWYVVQLLKSWDSLSIGPYRVGGVDGDGEPERWLPVFSTRSAAEAYAEGRAGISELRIVEP